MGSLFSNNSATQAQIVAPDRTNYEMAMANRDKLTRNEPYKPMFTVGEKIKRNPIDIALPMIRDYETFQSKPYDDGYGNMTIGYGMTTLPSGEKVTANTPALTKAQADEMLIMKVGSFTRILEKFPTYKELKPNQQAALIDLAFNIGPNFDAKGRNGKLLYPTLSAIMKDPSRADELKTLIPQFRMANGKPSKGLEARRRDTLQMFSDENFSYQTREERAKKR